MISKEAIIQSHERIRKYIHKTPILSNNTIALKAGCTEFYLKC